jgi:hypothetical protein
MKLISQVYAAIEQGGEITGPGTFQTSTDPGGSLEKFISVIVGAITVIAGIAFLIYFLLGGLNWVMAAGDPQKAEKARKQLTDAAIGLIIVVVTYFIVGIVGSVLGIDVLSPATILFTN